MQTISKSKTETAKIAAQFLHSLKLGTPSTKSSSARVVGLYGGLGAGKTTFAQAFARHLGIKAKIQSPTFLLIKRYPLKPIGISYGFRNFFHVDAYRLKNEREILKLGFKEILADPENLVLIEWPERIKKIMPKNHSRIHIEHRDGNTRLFKIKI